jgi:NADPH:quinone reductase-like Zn-dependent oxidoreductase
MADGSLMLAIAEVPVAQPAGSEVVIALEAVPVNPSDLMTMLATAGPANARRENGEVMLRVEPKPLEARKRRIGQPLAVGLTGAGTVIAAGEQAEDLIGRRVSAISMTRGSFGEYLTLDRAACAPLPDAVSCRDAADVFCNPMTVMAMVEEVKLAGQRAMIHTAAASNLGQMLVRVCAEDGIELVNVVRRAEQADLLRGMGARYVVNSTEPTFAKDLAAAVCATGATIAFDAIGGGDMAGTLHRAMEEAEAAKMPAYSPYGSPTPKHVHIYGYLDRSPTVLDVDAYGMQWNVGLWFQGATLAKVSQERVGALLGRVIAGLNGPFASHFAHVVSLDQMLDPEVMAGYARQATGEKYLIDPRL